MESGGSWIVTPTKPAPPRFVKQLGKIFGVIGAWRLQETTRMWANQGRIARKTDAAGARPVSMRPAFSLLCVYFFLSESPFLSAFLLSSS